LEGVLPTTYYYANLKNKYAMQEYEPLLGAFFNREFPTSWRQIDLSVDKMTAETDETEGEVEEADITVEEETDIADEEEVEEVL
jgi:hypothetical protein